MTIISATTASRLGLVICVNRATDAGDPRAAEVEVAARSGIDRGRQEMFASTISDRLVSLQSQVSRSRPVDTTVSLAERVGEA